MKLERSNNNFCGRGKNLEKNNEGVNGVGSCGKHVVDNIIMSMHLNEFEADKREKKKVFYKLLGEVRGS